MFLTTRQNEHTPKPGYVYRFDSTTLHQQYYFVCRLGHGVQSHAQLVVDRETGLKVVQKVDRLLCPSPLEHEEPAEISILRRLNSSHRLAGYQPRWITLLNFEKVLAYQETGASDIHLSHQVSYWKFCNGGTLHDLLRPYYTQQGASVYGERYRQNGQPSLQVLPKLPISLVARAVRHLCETLEAMYQGGSEPVYHCDLHSSNIFMHWTKEDPLPEFYIGDFGMARTVTQSLLNSQTFIPEGGIPFNQQPEGTRPAGVAPKGRRPRWDLDMHLTNKFKFMVEIAAKDATSRTTDSVRSWVQKQPQAPQWNSTRRDLVKQIAREKNEPAWRHRHNKANNSPRPRNPDHNNNISGPQDNNTHTKSANLALRLYNLFKSLETLNEQDQLTAVLQPHLRPPSLSHVIEAARQLEHESLQHEQHTLIFKEFVVPKKRMALFQEFGTKPFVFRRDGPEAKEMLRNALKRPPQPKDPYGFPLCYRGTVGGLGEQEGLEEIWGRENVAGPWRVVEVRV